MMRLLAFVSLVLLFGSRAPAGQPRPPAAEQGSQIGRPVGPVKIEEFGLWNALKDLAQQKQFVIGLVGDDRDMQISFKVNLESATIGEVLDALIRQAPAFSWQEEPSGTFRVTSKSLVNDLADLQVSYPGAANLTREQFWRNLEVFQPVSTWLNTHSCKRWDIFNGHEFSDRNDPMEIRGATESVSDLLNEVAGKSGADFWGIMRRIDDGHCSVQIIVW
jgi:hypothetical protein